MPRKKRSIDSEFKLDVVSVRLVQDIPLLSDHRICSPEDAIDVIGKYLCDMDREVVCVVNLKGDNTPINCHIASVGAINQTVAHPRELLKSAVLLQSFPKNLFLCKIEKKDREDRVMNHFKSKQSR